MGNPALAGISAFAIEGVLNRISDLLVADIVSGVAQNARRHSPHDVPSNAGSALTGQT